jgi:hypothetical protein
MGGLVPGEHVLCMYVLMHSVPGWLLQHGAAARAAQMTSGVSGRRPQLSKACVMCQCRSYIVYVCQDTPLLWIDVELGCAAGCHLCRLRRGISSLYSRAPPAGTAMVHPPVLAKAALRTTLQLQSARGQLE